MPPSIDELSLCEPAQRCKMALGQNRGLVTAQDELKELIAIAQLLFQFALKLRLTPKKLLSAFF